MARLQPGLRFLLLKRKPLRRADKLTPMCAAEQPARAEEQAQKTEWARASGFMLIFGPSQFTSTCMALKWSQLYRAKLQAMIRPKIMARSRNSQLLALMLKATLSPLAGPCKAGERLALTIPEGVALLPIWIFGNFGIAEPFGASLPCSVIIYSAVARGQTSKIQDY